MGKNTLTCRVHEIFSPKEDGFSLIEVLIAIAIFSIGFLAIGALQTTATMGTTAARSSTELSSYASDQMEWLTRLPYNDANLVEGVEHSAVNPNDDRFSASWVIVDDEIFSDTKTLTMTAMEESRGTRTLSLQYVIPRR